MNIYIIIMSNQWITVSNKKNINKSKLYVPPLIKTNIYKKELKFPNLKKELFVFIDDLNKKISIINYYILGKLYINNIDSKGSVIFERLDKVSNTDFNNHMLNKKIIDINKSLMLIKKFKYITYKNENLVNNLFTDIKNLYNNCQKELERIKLKNKFYDGLIYNVNNVKFINLPEWKNNTIVYKYHIKKEKEMKLEQMNKSKIIKNKKFTDLFNK